MQPEAGEIPSGLEAPGQEGITNGDPGAPSVYVRHRSQQSDDTNRDREGRGGSSPLPPASIDAPVPIPPTAGGAAPGVDNPDEDSPTGDQYADTLARLSNDLN